MKILGLDPGLASFGWCVSEASTCPVHGDFELKLIDCGVIETKPIAEISKAVALNHRCGYIYGLLKNKVLSHKVDLICIEGQPFVKGFTNATVMISMGRVRGLVDAIAADTRFKILECSPQELKRITNDKSKKQKKDISDAVQIRWPNFRWNSKGTLEHVADACGTVIYFESAIQRILERQYTE